MQPQGTILRRGINPPIVPQNPDIQMKTLLPLAAGLALATSLHAATIFSDDFSGGSGDPLDGTTPDVTTGGATWVAASIFNADGTTEDNAGSATLAFTPTSGFIYTLDASFSGLGLVGDPDVDWMAAGFVNTNASSGTGGTNDRFITGDTVGTAWTLARGDQPLDPNAVGYSGTGALGTGNGGLAGGSVGIQLLPIASAIDMRIVLDTTGGAGPADWTATWSVKRPADSSYTLVRATETLQSGAVISAVGIARSNPGITGKADSFTLTSVVPEPSTVALLGLGSLALLRRRRG
jgi:hypothetical protein